MILLTRQPLGGRIQYPAEAELLQAALAPADAGGAVERNDHVAEVAGDWWSR